VSAPSGPDRTATSPAVTRRLLRVMPFGVLGFVLYLVLHTIGSLLNEVQLASDASFGGLGKVATGLSPGAIDTTQSLLATWSEASADPQRHNLIAWTSRAYTAIEYIFLISYAVVLVGVWLVMRLQLPDGAGRDPGGLNRLRQLAHWRYAWIFAVGAAAADAVQNSIRFFIVEETVARNPVPNWVIGVAWGFDLLKVALIALSIVLIVVLLFETRKVGTWLRVSLTALWRLRLAVVAVGLYATLLLVDPTGQTTDLARRWSDDATGLVAAVLAFASSILLGLSIWLYSRRVVLSESPQRPTRVPWTPILLGVVVVAVALGRLLHWTESYAIAIVAGAVALLGLLVSRRPLTGEKNMDEAVANAQAERSKVAGNPPMDEAGAVRHATRVLAVLAPLTILLLAATAYAPVMIVLPLSHQERTGVFDLAVALVVIAVLGAPLATMGAFALLRSWDGEVTDVPLELEGRYIVGGIAAAVALALSITGAQLHWPAVDGFLVTATFLAAVMLALGEAQRWAETHSAPSGMIGIGFTRMPVALLLVGSLLLASFAFNDGSDHNVHRQGTLPGGLSTADGQTGITLTTAFQQWIDANCAGAGHAGTQVPMYFVTAPGGGLRAAYWTASTLSDLFGPDRSGLVPNCPGTAPADRIFAMGGASGGSLGVLSYEAGLTGQRSSTWFDSQLGRPDFLTDPLSWMLTTDLGRAFLGYGGQDRAQRLEASFARNVTGLDSDFFAGTYGLGGRTPLMMLTGTQVESGCRLNVSGLRLTSVNSRSDGIGCAGLGQGADQSNAARTTDVLDVVCSADGTTPESFSKATAALLSARFPYVSPSGQLYYCVNKPNEQTGSTAIVDGGYAENTGIGMLLSLWPRLEPLIIAHNEKAGNATIVPVFIEVANDYAQVAAATQRSRTAEGLVPPVTQNRPSQLDSRAMEQTAAATFTGPVPGVTGGCDLTPGSGRFLVISPLTSPGLPAPLAWTLSQVAVDDLTAQRQSAVAQPGPQAVRIWADGHVSCAY
jgi:hypothetical protein